MPSTALKISSPKISVKNLFNTGRAVLRKELREDTEGFKASSGHWAGTNTEASAGAPTTEKGNTIKVTG